MFKRFSSLFFAAFLMTGCAVLPGDGPSAIDIKADDIVNLPPKEYVVVDIDSNVANVAGQARHDDFAEHFSIRKTGHSQRIGVGDDLVVGIWEAGANGLFSTNEGKQTKIQTEVDETGRIFIPYAGRIHASGMTVEALREKIQNQLLDKAIQPQVLVAVRGSQANSAVIVGDVKKPGRMPISVAGTRVLDLVAEAGGSKYPTYETMVTLKRGDRTAAILLENLFDFPENNVYLMPDDNILLAHMPRSFTLFGAIGKTQEVAFNTRTVTLAEAIARGGGLSDDRADPSGVFLFRFEDVGIARQLSDKVEDKGLAGYRVPVVYRLNLREPKAFFLARYFELRDKDIVYVASHPTAEFAKFIRMLGPSANYAQKIDQIMAR